MYQKIKQVFYPESILPKTLIQKWYLDNKDAYITTTNIILIVGAILMFAQLILMDLPSHFYPSWLFVLHRTATAFFCLTAIILGKKIRSIYWYKVPYLVVFSFFVVGQYILMYYEHRIPFFIGILDLCFACVAMGYSVGFSLILTTILYSILIPFIIPILHTNKVPVLQQLIGFYIMVVLIVCFFRTRVFKDVRIFWLNQQNLELAESERQAKQELENAQMKIIQTSQLAELGQMSASVAHEINSPLRGVAWSVGAMEDVIKEGKFAEEEINYLKEDLGKIKEGISYINLVIKNIGSSAGSPDAPSQMELISDVINIAVGVTGYSFKGKAKIHIDVSPDLKAWMQKVKAIRCIVNLISNAVYAMEEAHTRDAQIKIYSNLKENRVQIIIQDNGPGLPKKVQENIFKPFNTSKPVGVGIGLGLSMVKNMMEEMGGQVDYRTSNQGTEFMLIFLSA